MARDVDTVHVVVVVIDGDRNFEHLFVIPLEHGPDNISVRRRRFWSMTINFNSVLLAVKTVSYGNSNNSVIVLPNEV